MKFKFIAEKHEDFGEMGWRLKDQPGFDPLGGMGVAHDVLEHLPNGDESPADEFQALGAGWLIRGEGGLFSSGHYAPEENMSAEFPEIIRHVIYEGMRVPEPPRTRALDGSAEESLQLIVSRARKLCCAGEHPEFEKEDHAAVLDVLRKALGWMRVGYRRAARRYKNALGFARCAFGQIQEEADKRLKHAEQWQELHVSINIARRDCQVEFLEYPEYAY